MNKTPSSSMEALLPPKYSRDGEVVKNAQIVIEKLLFVEKKIERVEHIRTNVRYFISKKRNINKIKKKLEQLEWYHQTTPLSKEEESEIIENIKKLSKELSNFEKVKAALKKDGIEIFNVRQAKAIKEMIDQLTEEMQNMSKRKENEIFERALDKLKKGEWMNFHEFSTLVRRNVIA
jgi:uncharacterized coiled-coil DUF342 family protein